MLGSARPPLPGPGADLSQRITPLTLEGLQEPLLRGTEFHLTGLWPLAADSLTHKPGVQNYLYALGFAFYMGHHPQRCQVGVT